MSFGGNYNGGRTRMGTPILLNIYDLSPANECLYAAGLGLHHSGVEILGTEYTFASGAGIFEMTPKDGQGAKFRQSIELGIFQGDAAGIRNAISDLRNDFGPDKYNLIHKNCNHFANALSYSLLGKTIPPHVNRLANIGSYVSCILPKKMLENAPVGNTNNESSSGFQVQAPGSRSVMNERDNFATAFSGKGMTLGASSSSTSGSAGGVRNILGNIKGFGSSSTGNKGSDDLTDRREKARRAAMARLVDDDKSH